jgi:uncharacterized membrane protein YeiB
MIDNLVRNLQLLHKANGLIGKIWVTVIARRFGFLAFAGLISAFGLAMANVAGLYALQASIGSVWAAASVAAADFVIAAFVMLLARSCGPGPELELALDVRRIAIEAIQTDAREIKTTIDTLGQEVLDVKQTLVGFVHNPLDMAAQKLLIPAAISIVRGLRAKKAEGLARSHSSQ